MRATPGGMKKNPRLATKKSDIPCTQCSFIQPNFKKRVSSSMPMMLDGSLIPVKNTINSPKGKHPKKDGALTDHNT